MVFFRPKLSKTDNMVRPWILIQIETNLFNEVSGVARWVQSVNMGAFVPKLIHMPSSPTWICCNFISEDSTQFIKEDENLIVDLLNLWLHGTNILVVELLSTISYRLEHVWLDNWVVCIRVNLTSKEDPNEWISKPNSHSIYKNVTGHQIVGVNAHVDWSYSLPD